MFKTVDVAVAASALAAALVYWLRFAAREEVSAGGATIKALSTGLLAVVPWLSVLLAVPGLWPIALGLTLGALGDWFLARKGEAAFLAGMAAFGAGHLAYATGLLGWRLDDLSAGEGALMAALVVLLASTEVWLAPRTGTLRWPVRGYVMVIGVMALALVLLPEGEGRWLLQLGGALFVLSDLLLALRLFVVTDKAWHRRLSLALWPAYWGGQALIAYGAMIYWLNRPG
jgi:uncharacterized membrane protein YhhN